MPEKTGEQGATGKKRRKRHIIWRITKYFILFIVLVLCLGAGAAAWITQSESGQAWLVKTANGALAQSGDGLGFRITHLSGSIPFNFDFGLESSDKNGVWLKAPANKFVWDWKALPGTIYFKTIAARDVDISRFPDLPPKREEPPTPEKPLTIADIKSILDSAASFLNESHWWLPDLKIDAIESTALLPESLLPAKEPQRLALDALIKASFSENTLKSDLSVNMKNALGENLAMDAIKLARAGVNLDLQAGPKDKGLAATIALKSDIAKPVFAVTAIPPDLAGDRIALSLRLDAEAGDGLSAALSGPDLDAGHLQVSGKGAWNTSDWQSDSLAGPINYSLSLVFEPLEEGEKSPLAAIRAPAKALLKINGDLPKINLDIALACAEVEEAGHAITGTDLAIKANDLDIPLDADAMKALESEKLIAVDFKSAIDQQKIALASDLFFQKLAEDSGWRAGARKLSLEAAGLTGSGDIAAIIPAQGHPALDGDLRFGLKHWEAIEKLLPGKTFSGQIALAVKLASQIAPEFSNPSKTASGAFKDSPRQSASVKLDIPSFQMREAGAAKVAASNIKGDIGLSDLFDDPAIKAALEAGNIEAAGLKLSAHIAANGPFKGPLKAEISSKGSVNSKIAAEWRPGEAKLSALEAVADLSPFIGVSKGKKALAGIRSTQTATINYGDKGLAVKGLDLRLLPAGRLTANGGLSPEKLDLRLDLQNLDFAPWQALIPQLPKGSASLKANLSGSPNKPGGNFQLNVQNVVLPGNIMPPVSLAATGQIARGASGSALGVKLALDPTTVKALGGNEAIITASLPLVFGEDGIPAPDMKGPLAAKIRWDGALGPIWNLLPIADQRLNGRVAVNLDAGGTLATPKVNGFLAINKARYENIGVGVLLTDINLRVDLSDSGGRAKKGALDSLPGRMKLALSLSDGFGGSVTANGGGDLNGDNLDINAKITNLQPLRRRDVHVQLSGAATVKGTALAPDIKGEIVVNKGEVLLNNIAMTASVTTLDITDPAVEKAKKEAPKKEKASGEGGRLDIRFVMLPRFSVEGRGLASLWQANLLISGPLTDPSITGNISCVRGNFDFLGKVFALTKGIVFFGGGSLSNPLVDIEMTYDTPDLDAHIMVSGPVSKIKLTLTSDPTMPRDEILSRVLFGRSVNDLSRMEALQLAGAVAQLAGFGGGSGPLGFAKKALGVDVLRIGTANTGAANQTSDETGGGTTIEAGKYINDYIYMGVQQGFKADSTAFIIEIELTPRTNLELRTEQDNTWGGIKWRMNY